MQYDVSKEKLLKEPCPDCKYCLNKKLHCKICLLYTSFDAQKIYNAIFKANIRIADEKLTEQQLNALTKEIVDVYKRQP